MSGIPLGYFLGLGAVPAGRADPAACARLTEAYRLYQESLSMPGRRGKEIQAERKAVWQALVAARACREAEKPAAPPAAAPVPSTPSSAPSSSSSSAPPKSTFTPFSMAIPSFTTTEREPISSMFSTPSWNAPVTSSAGRWKLAVGGLMAIAGLFALVKLAGRARRPEDEWRS